MCSRRPTTSGLATAKPLVPATKAAARAKLVVGSKLHPDPSHPSPDASGSSPSHPALNALARLLARQISSSGGADG